MKIDAGRLRGFLDCMHLEADQRDRHTTQIRDIVKAAKEAGYDPKAVRKVFVRERMDDAERNKQDDLLESYEAALGPKGAALRAIEAGATLDEAAEATGLGRATVARARAVSRQGSNDTARVSQQTGNDTTPHDPNTGEIHAEDKEGQDQGARRGGRVLRQPEPGNAGADARASGELRAGQDDAGEDGGRVRGEGTAQDQLTISELVDADLIEAAELHNAGISGAIAESANNESCGGDGGSGRTREPLADADGGLGATQAVPRVPSVAPGPHDTYPVSQVPTGSHAAAGNEGGSHDRGRLTAEPEVARAAPPAILHASDCAVHNEPAYPAGPCDCGANPTRAENAQVPITRGEARPNPDEDDLAIPNFLRRTSARAEA